MKWPYTRRIDATPAWSLVALGGAGILGLPAILVGVHGQEPHFRWWWPTNFMIIPVMVLLSGVFLVLVPVRRAEAKAPAFEPGDGAPSWKVPFQQAWQDAVAHGAKGEPSTPVYDDGPGVVQNFGSADSPDGWVLSARPGHRVVVLPGDIWQALRVVGRGAIGGDSISALGVPTADTGSTRFIDRQALRVELTGGSWGDGQLVRDNVSSPWRWEPKVRFSTETSTLVLRWTPNADAASHMRLRALTVLPWADANDLQITTAGRNRLLQALPDSDLAVAVAALSQTRGGDLHLGPWERGPNSNALDRLSYSSTVLASDGRTALTAEVMLSLPDTMSRAVVSCAELRIESLDAWESALPEPADGSPRDMRLTPPELAKFFASAWRTAAELLPGTLVDNVTAMRWNGPPSTSLWFGFSNPLLQPQPLLKDFIDMRTFGVSDRGPHTQMTAMIIAAPHLPESLRRDVIRDALAQMAQRFGFLDVTEDQF